MLEWVISSSVLILLVLIVRALGKGRLSCRVRYALWMLVLVRLLIPAQLIETPWSVSVSVPGTLTEKRFGRETVSTLELDTAGYNAYGDPLFKNDADREAWERFSEDVPQDARAGERSLIAQVLQDRAVATWYAYHWSAADILRMFWFAGAGLLAAVLLLSNLRFARRLKRRRVPYDALCGGMRVYVAEGLASPCLVGVFRPSVYLTTESTRSEQTLRHVLAHEETHKRHGDCVWSALRLIALCLHWYNPLVWYAVIVSKRDGELACDEATLIRLGEEERIPYGETLLSMVTAKPSGRDVLSASTAMTAEKRTLRERIETIAKHPRTRGAALLLVCAVLLSATVFAFSKSAVKNPHVREYVPGDGATALSPDATKVPLDAEEAMQDLVDSVQWFEGDDGVRYVSFRLPGAYDPEPKWNLHISGRSVAEDGMSMSRHYFEGESWRAGKSYSIELTDLTELTLTAWLADGHGGSVTRDIDLLTGRAYALVGAGKADSVSLHVTDSYEVAARRRDGDGWFIYVPLSGWSETSSGGETRWNSEAGSTLSVKWLEKAADSDLAVGVRYADRSEEGVQKLHYENPYTHQYRSVHLHPASNGGYWQVLTQYDTHLRLLSSFQGLEPELLDVMAESFQTGGTAEQESDDPAGSEYANIPSESESLALRRRVVSGMTDDEINYLTEMIMGEHYWWEYQYLYTKTFQMMGDPHSLLWNYIDRSGEIQIGWAYDGSIDKDAVCAEEGLTEDEFYERHGEKVIEPDNTRDAASFRTRMTALKESVKSGLLDDDFDRMIALCDRARETHDVNEVIELYHMLHDLDYYVLRYGPSDVGSRTWGPSIASKYYGCLRVWDS